MSETKETQRIEDRVQEALKAAYQFGDDVYNVCNGLKSLVAVKDFDDELWQILEETDNRASRLRNSVELVLKDMDWREDDEPAEAEPAAEADEPEAEPEAKESDDPSQSRILCLSRALYSAQGAAKTIRAAAAAIDAISEQHDHCEFAYDMLAQEITRAVEHFEGHNEAALKVAFLKSA